MVLYLIVYASIAVFVLAVITRAARLSSLPVHLRWELCPVPHEKNAAHGGSFFEHVDWWKHPRESDKVGELKVMLAEILLLKGVREHNRPLWARTFPFHLRLMGIVEPQRRVLRAIAPKFREMHPHGADNYCCGGGSGFAIMSGHNFSDWRMKASGRKKLRQVLEAFADDLDPAHPKYLCAPCSNCKGQMRDVPHYYGAKERVGIHYGGLVELIVNAMVNVKPGFLSFEEE